MLPETDIFRSGTRDHSWFFFSLNIDNKMHFVSISIAFWRITHLYVIPTGNWKSSDKTFLSTLISSSNIETNNQYYKITCKCVAWLWFSYPNYVVCFKNLYELCNATATTARRSFDVTGKIAFMLWRHGHRRNGTMPTMGLALYKRAHEYPVLDRRPGSNDLELDFRWVCAVSCARMINIYTQRL